MPPEKAGLDERGPRYGPRGGPGVRSWGCGGVRMGGLAVVAGVRALVSPGLYLRVGLGLGVAKYALDLALIYAVTGKWLSPLAYLAPLATLRGPLLNDAPDGLLVALVVLTLPFAWVGASMSVRRARDAGLPAAAGLVFFVPLLNYLGFALLALAPSRPAAVGPGGAGAPLAGGDRVVWSALVSVAAAIALGFGVLGLAVYGLGEYGGTLFVGAPFGMGLLGGFLLNLRGDRGWLATAAQGALSVGILGGLMLLFALEGLICLAMAAPLGLVLSVGGALLGRALAGVEARRPLLTSLGLLPVLAVVEPPPGGGAVHPVTTAVEVDAPPEAVWDVVVAFPEIPSEVLPPWYFRAGVAYPIRARIEGAGPGAVRYCEFSTGPFVEPVMVWDPPRHLAFDVVDSPPTMFELSPWDTVFAPHLDGALQSQRGEFRLEPLPGGRTRLVGTTWYRFDMAPTAYWTLWSDAIIHAIHVRVLSHIAGVAEGR